MTAFDHSAFRSSLCFRRWPQRPASMQACPSRGFYYTLGPRTRGTSRWELVPQVRWDKLGEDSTFGEATLRFAEIKEKLEFLSDALAGDGARLAVLFGSTLEQPVGWDVAWPCYLRNIASSNIWRRWRPRALGTRLSGDLSGGHTPVGRLRRVRQAGSGLSGRHAV